MNQHITINIIDAPAVPDTGWLSTLSDGITPSLLLVLTAVIIALLLSAWVFRRHKKPLIGLSAFILLPILALLTAAAPATKALSDLALDRENLAIDIIRGNGPVTKSTTFTSTVTTDNNTGYTLSAKAASTLPAGITVTLDSQTLTTTPTIVDSTSTGDSPSTYHNTLAVTASDSIPLGAYAIDIEYTVEDNPSNMPTTMQSMTRDYCANHMATYLGTAVDPDEANKLLALTDIRNGQQYLIGKLADGNCWMLDNLKLELGVSNADPTLDTTVLEPENTTVTTVTPIYFTQDGTSTGAPLTGMTGNFTTSSYNTRDGTSNTLNPPDNQDVWRQNDPSNLTGCVDNIGSVTTYDNDRKVYHDDSLTKCGYLYNFYTATAGSSPQAEYGTAPHVSGYAAPGSICPASWRLPTGYSNNTPSGEFFFLRNAWGASFNVGVGNWFPGGPFRGVFAGTWARTTNRLGGSNGYYWSSSLSSQGYSVQGVDFSSSQSYAGSDVISRYNGYAVRCLLD